MLKVNALCLGLLTLSLPLKADILNLTSLEWPPYASEVVEQQGASVAVVKAAVEAMGHELNVEFYPWERAVHLAKNKPDYAGYFPEYYFEADDLLFSQSIGTGPLGFVENKSNPVTWSSLNDLKSINIGVVRGYVNTTELDNMIANQEIKAVAVTSDSRNILKVAGKRIPLAVIDSNVLDYLLKSDPDIASAKDKVKMNSKLLEEKDLFVAFANDENGKKWRTIINQGLKKIDSEAIMKRYFSK
ncbi:substrate-binding periplasmic protein [Vibrio caribbeanicus]|uniref:Uncharacterized protein n=1 Tax=Vibrio caribbeanicus ATCC BAA-2122 TaxID=796620 RepID=E3BPW0_9VIBR|nr:transporter substrate-binding domain-containing protein [Vibrio caribbeanicus]EFP94885.1 hypothetical protein VIBC2010_02421 [Vibrio caribbeanicus ATCC BAA-2122]